MQATRVDSVLVSGLPEVSQMFIKEHTESATSYHTSKVILDSVEYACGMFVSVGSDSGLPTFGGIKEIYLLNNSVYFLLLKYVSWFKEHLCSYELTPPQHLSVHQQTDFSDPTPLCLRDKQHSGPDSQEVYPG